MNSRYPLSAFYRQKKAVQALLLLAIHPGIGSLLLLGKKGTGKTVLLRSLESVIEERVVDLPLNCTIDHLIGGLSLENALQKGERKLQTGLLSRAKNGVLLVDNINFLSSSIRSLLLQAHEEGRIIIEREGISQEEKTRFCIIGAMNPEEGELSSAQMDRFSLCVNLDDQNDLDSRIEILNRRFAYEENPEDFCKEWEKETVALKKLICHGRRLLPKIKISHEQLRLISQIVYQVECLGHRGELALCETSRAIAALKGQSCVYEEDIVEAAQYTLVHRITNPIELQRESDVTSKAEENNQQLEENINEGQQQHFEGLDSSQEPGEETQFEKPDQLTKPIELRPLERKKTFGQGRRNLLYHSSDRGREIGDKIPKEKVKDLAIVATLRAAALEQRKSDKLIVKIKPEDLREKKKESSGGARVLFLVDGSGSMGASRRMKFVKGVVLSLLNDSYLKRDSVGVMVFRGNKAKLILPFTRSIDRAKHCLEELKTGGKTPLALGLDEALRTLKLDSLKHRDTSHLVVLVTDGKNNVAPRGEDSWGYVTKLALKYRKRGIRTIVIDTEEGFMKFGYAKKLSHHLGAQYLSIADLAADLATGRKKIMIEIYPS